MKLTNKIYNLFTTRKFRASRVKSKYRKTIGKGGIAGNPSVIQADFITTSTGEVLDVSELTNLLK